MSVRLQRQIASLTNFGIPEERIILEERYLKRRRRERVACIEALQRFYDEAAPPDRQEAAAAETQTTAASQQQHETTGRSPALSMNKKRQMSIESESRKPEELRRTSVGIWQVADVDVAVVCVFKEPDNDLVVVCGWPRGIHVFFTALRNSAACNAVILAPAHPVGLAVDALLPFAHMCAWVRGSALDVTDLVRSGVLQARCCCVFSTMHVPWCLDVSHYRTDTQAVLAREFIYALHHCDSMLQRRARHLRQAEGQRRRRTQAVLADVEPIQTDDVSIRPSSPPELRQRRRGDATANSGRQAASGGQEQPPSRGRTQQKENMSKVPSATYVPRSAPLVVVELQSDERVEYLDITPVKTAAPFFAKSDADNIWSQHGLFMANPEFTSGRVLLEEMLYGMICFSLPVSRFCTDSRIIDHLVSGSHVPLPRGYRPSCPIWLIPLPPSYEGLTFGVLMDELLKETLNLPIAVYRHTRKMAAKKTPLDLLQGEAAVQSIVISCPPLDLVLEPDDQVYVIRACPREALGLLFSGGA